MIIIDNKTISKPIIDILKTIREEVNNGKLREIKVRGDNIRCSCPFHKDGLENKASCDIYIGESDKVETGWFKCFTCNEQGPFYKFVGKCFDADDEFGKQWLVERFYDGFVEREFYLDPIDIKNYKKKKYLDERMLDAFEDYHPYMLKRKLSKDICSRFKVKYDRKTESLVFPVWDIKNNLVMLTRRSVNNKTFIIDKDCEKPVYLLNYITKNKIKEATVVESQINCLSLWSWNIPSIATFGCNVTEKQINDINKSGINHLYICFDGDEAGRHGTINLIKKLKKDIIIDVIVMDKGKDVNDITEDRFDKLPIVDSEKWLLSNNK